MRKIILAGLVIGAIALAVPLTGTALAAYSRHTPATQPAASAQPAVTASAQPAVTASAQPSPFPSWTQTGPYNFHGPGTIDPSGAPDYIGYGPASCPAVSQQGGQWNGQGHQPAAGS